MPSGPMRAILFSAGFGTRLRPLTEHTPKALIKLGDKTILDHAIDAFDAAGCERIVVNSHHLGEQIERHLDARRKKHDLRAELIHVPEPVLLETGGAIVNALPWLGEDDAFFTANMDAVWFDDGLSTIASMRKAYDPAQMDALLLLQPRTRLVSYGGGGDFGLNPAGELTREGERPYVYASLQLIHPRLFAGRRAEPFSLREQWFSGQRADGSLSRMHGLVHEGDWLHVGSPSELSAAEAWLSARG
jgi:N-acetyl-alpha-D-muramate 1-phosphate uridylyltransferase